MKIIETNISELNPAKYNPRLLNETQAKTLEESLSKFGLVDPIIVNKKGNTIVGGHQRVKVWKSMGNKTVPVFFVDLDEKKEKELNVRLNANTGDWDYDMLSKEFDAEELAEWGLEMSDIKLDEGFGEGFALPSGDKTGLDQMTFTFSSSQAEEVQRILSGVKKTEDFKEFESIDNKNSNGNALYLIFTQWEKQKK
jgi:hypothetical protein